MKSNKRKIVTIIGLIIIIGMLSGRVVSWIRNYPLTEYLLSDTITSVTLHQEPRKAKEISDVKEIEKLIDILEIGKWKPIRSFELKSATSNYIFIQPNKREIQLVDSKGGYGYALVNGIYYKMPVSTYYRICSYVNNTLLEIENE